MITQVHLAHITKAPLLFLSKALANEVSRHIVASSLIVQDLCYEIQRKRG